MTGTLNITKVERKLYIFLCNLHYIEKLGGGK